jgi:hypothetical protein
MNPNEPVVSGNFALRLTGVLLIAFGLAFYLYYGINTISDPVFSIDFSPYYVAGQLLAEGRTPELIPQPADGFFTTSSKPYLEAFQKYFFPDSQVATGWIYPAAYAWLFRPFVGMDFELCLDWSGSICKAVERQSTVSFLEKRIYRFYWIDLSTNPGQFVAWEYLCLDPVFFLPELSLIKTRTVYLGWICSGAHRPFKINPGFVYLIFHLEKELEIYARCGCRFIRGCGTHLDDRGVQWSGRLCSHDPGAIKSGRCSSVQ